MAGTVRNAGDKESNKIEEVSAQRTWQLTGKVTFIQQLAPRDFCLLMVAAVPKVPKLDDLKNRNVLSHNAEIWNTDIQVCQ